MESFGLWSVAEEEQGDKSELFTDLFAFSFREADLWWCKENQNVKRLYEV